MIRPLRWLPGPLFTSPQTPGGLPAADLVLQRHLAWRRNVLVLVLVLTALTAIIDTTTRLVSGPRLSFQFTIWLDPETAPPEQTLFGDLADLAWLLSFYAMPAAALLAVAFWSRPRTSRAILLAGWIASFLVPVAIALTPWSWWNIESPPPATRAARLAREYERITEGIVWGYYYLVVLSPAVLALVPGTLRACVRVKQLLPESILPGWFLVAAAPFNSLLVVVAVVALAQLAPSSLLLAGMLLWLAAPLAYLVRASTFTRPLSSSEDLRRLTRVQIIVWALMVAASACLITYAATWEAFGLRLVGLEPRTSLLRPWQVARYFLDFLGRSLFITVLGADLLLWATLSVWRQQREFTQSAHAADYDQLMEQLSSRTELMDPPLPFPGNENG
jgi:hypothetical protein